jgi:hydroxymethylpyrimidine pyrophosphatase-like HAD family hydrolase
MTTQDYNNKANELNSKFPNLKAEVTTGWDGNLQITVCNSDKAKTLKEMYKNFKFNF